MAIQRLEYVKGRSSKFWEIMLLDDAISVCIRFGRIGTNGQSKVKRFMTSIHANLYIDNAVREKLNKGYERVPLAQASTVKPKRAISTGDTTPVKARPKRKTLI